MQASRVRSRTGSRTRLCLRKNLFWRYPRPIRNRPCRCEAARKNLTRSCGAAEDVREVLKISLRSLRPLRLKTLADFVRDPENFWASSLGNDRTLDKAAPMGDALPDASVPLRSTLAPTPHSSLLIPNSIHLLSFLLTIFFQNDTLSA